MSEYIKYSYEQLKTFCEDCFCHFGFTPDESGIITDVLLMSDLFGIESHGMQRLARYHKGIEKGLIKVDAKPEIVFETPVSAVIDGHDGMGQLISHKAMEIAIEKAKRSEWLWSRYAIRTTSVLPATTQKWLATQACSEWL